MTATTLETRAPTRPARLQRPAEQRVEFVLDANKKKHCVFVESDGERLTRVLAQIAYWSDPANGEEPKLARGNRAYWERYLLELHDRGVGIAV